MKTSINAWSVCGSSDFEETFKVCSNAGFEGIELNIEVEGASAHSLTLNTDDATLDSIAALSEKYSLPVISISTNLWEGGAIMGSGKAEDFERSARLLDRQFYFATKLGAKTILIVPGGMSDDVTMAQAYNNSVDTLKRLAPVFEKYSSVKAGIENVWNMFLTSPFDMARFVDDVNIPNLGAYYDLGNTIAFSRSEDWVEILGDRIVNLHIKGYKRNNLGFGINEGGNWCYILDSEYKWDRVRKALDKIGYDGYVSAELGKFDENQSWDDYYAMVKSQIDSIIK